MKTLVAILITALLSSCAAEYQSPRTGIKYSFNVPVEAFLNRLPASVKITPPPTAVPVTPEK